MFLKVLIVTPQYLRREEMCLKSDYQSEVSKRSGDSGKPGGFLVFQKTPVEIEGEKDCY